MCNAVRFVIVILFACLFQNIQAQVQSPRYISTSANSGGFYEYLPQGYNSSQTYPLLVFIHGTGELGQGNSSDLPKVLWNAVPHLINSGQFPLSFTVNGQTHKFIVISPQFKQWPTPADVDAVVAHAIQNYRVNTSRVYVTGLSMGGGTTWEYAAAYPGRVAAIVPTCGASWPDPSKSQNIANGNIAVWGTHNDFDGTVASSNTKDYVSQIIQFGGNAKKTIWNVGGHDSWSQTYNTNFRENGLNVYEWMLQYQKGSPPPPSNQMPTANAGSDKNISLPTNSTSLSGSGTDPDGTIASYNWTKVSGPSATINSPSSGNTSVSNLVQGSYTFRLTVTDNLGSQSSDDVSVTVNAGYIPLPGKIEAENWNAMSGVQTESTSDAGGGLNVGWIDNGDWMDYSINPSSTGNYTVSFRVATAAALAQLQIRKADGTILTTLNVPNTGGFQSWQTATVNITLSAGNQTLRIISTSPGGAGVNINWLDFTTAIAPAPLPGAIALPGKLEAENWISMNGVQVENTLDAGGGKNVGWIDNADWMEYSVNPSAAGTFTVNLRVASLYSGAQLQIKKSDGSVLASVNVPITGGFQTWQTTSTTITLAAGMQTIKIVSSASPGFNINWIDFGTSAIIPPPPPGGTSTKIEAENWSAMSGVQTETVFDAGGGLNVGWIDNGDWMNYSYTASAAGTYSINLRIATLFSGTQLQIKKGDGSVLATVDIPITNGFQLWRTISVNVTLSAGTQTLRIQSTSSAGWNINWLQIESSAIAPPPPISTSTKIEAESYSSMAGVQTENTSDIGGGLNVGWIDNGDWMNYSYTAPTAGTYTINFRVAAFNSGAQFQIKRSFGATVLATINIPATGGYQTWQTVSVNVTLPEGVQIIKLRSSSSIIWNINWLEVSPAASSARSSEVSIAENELATANDKALDIFPNPVTDRFVLQVNNELSGAVNVQIFNLQGSLQKQFTLSKAAAGSIQYYLSIGDFTAGSYFVKVSMKDWTQSKQIIKQ